MTNNQDRSIVHFSSRCIFLFLTCFNFYIIVKLSQLTEPTKIERFPNDNPYVDVFVYILLFVALTAAAYACSKSIRLFWNKLERIEQLSEESD